jgi:mono/diheme cytochrome c family protein
MQTIERHQATAAIAVLFFLVGLSAIATRAQAEGTKNDREVVRGEGIARLICATCHVVASDQQFPPMLVQRTPSFSEIANRPGINGEAIQGFITTTHWDEKTLPMKMPSLGLTRDQALAVASYILSLRK